MPRMDIPPGATEARVRPARRSWQRHSGKPRPFWRRLGRLRLGRIRLGPASAGLLRLLPALLPALLFVPFMLAPPLNHDVAAVLSFSERWLAGEQLYSDLIDVNPPLIFVL